MDDHAVDELFDLPPAAFVAARDALAKRLKADGAKEAAAAVKGLRRPTVAAWGVNQVAREQPVVVDAVIDAAAALGSAQRALVAGGDRVALRVATKALREATTAAVRAAMVLTGGSQRDAVAATFDAVATDPDAAQAVRQGRLTEALESAGGFGVLGELPAPAASVTAKVDDEVARRRIEEAEQRVARADAEVATAEEAVAAASARLDRARRSAAEAEVALDDLRRRFASR